jgi:predicted nucleic acid-binding protein
VIEAERLGQTAYQMVARLGPGETEMAVSVVTVLELAHGVARASSERRHAARQRFLDDLLSGMPVHPVTIPVALREPGGSTECCNRGGFGWRWRIC